MQPVAVAPVSPLASQESRSLTERGITEREVFEEIEQHVGARNFEHWFRGKATLTFADGELVLGVGSAFLLTWMQKHFRGPIAAAAERFLGPSAQVRFEVDPRVALKPNTNTAGANTASGNPDGATLEAARGEDTSAIGAASHHAAMSVASLSGAASSAVPSVEITPSATNTAEEPVAQAPPEHSAKASPGKSPSFGSRRFADLADFVSGPCNELALMAARQVCDSPGARFNPLYLHGNPGTGKTHILEGIYRMIRRRHPALQVLYLTSEAFANHFTQALREHKLPGFRQRFRGVDVLLVDDVDFFDGKRVIQEEFLHTFQQLESHGRQIAVAADRHPRLLSKVGEDLTTRFVSGLVCKLEAPDFDTRLKIVERKSAGRSGSIAPEALTYIAQRFRNNVRELEGALNCLESYHALTRQRMTLAVARTALADLERDCIRAVRMPDVEQTVCTFFGVESRDLRSSRRQRVLSQPRMLAMFLIRKHTHAAYSEIGEHFGGRNHSTVIAAEKRIREMIDSGAPIRVASRSWRLDDLIDAIEQQLQAG